MAERIEQGTSETYRGDNHFALHDDHLRSRSFIETTVNCDRLVDRLESMNFLRDVALKLGAENTRKHLVPYLTHLIIAEKLSELRNLAEVLGEFENYVGGPKYAHILLLPLEELAGAKVNNVRMAAIKSLQTLADIMEVIDLENFFIPFIASLTINDKSTKRMSVSHLFTTVYMRVSTKHQSDLIDYHCFLSLDSSPAVRQNAANNLVDFSEVVHMSIFDSKLTPRLEQFSFDQNEHVRILALSTAITISKKFDVSYTKQIILPIVLNSINDPSCGVRSILIKNIAKLLAIGVSCLKLTESIMKILISLAKDQQVEVRLSSVSVLYDCTVILYENLTYLEATKLVTKFLIPILSNFCNDSDVKCKLEVPSVLAKFGKIMSNVIIKDYFVDLVNKLLKDKNVDVIFNVVKYMKDILGSQYNNLIELPEDRLICCLKAFIINSSWKMRNTGAIYLYILAIQKGLKFFEDYLEQSFLILLTDTKSTVQQTAMDVFKLLVIEFGMDWAQTYIVPYLIKLSYSKNTYNKMAFLSFAKNCFEICDQLMLNELFPHVVYYQSDENPNVRYALVKTLNVMITSIADKDDILNDKIKSILKILITDTSNYISGLAMDVWDKHFNTQ